MMDVPGFNRTPRNYQERPCVVGMLRGRGNGRSMILNAHIDTAPVGALREWSEPPYSGVIRDGCLYGRGAWDDKAGVVECLTIVEALKRTGIRLQGNLIVKSVIEDEVTGNGTLACLERGYVADGAVIVDGTWPERFIVSHMGQVWFRVTLKGRSAPACMARRGSNPLSAVGIVIRALNDFVAEKNSRLATRWGSHNKPLFINVGRIQGGDWPGAVPSECVLEGQCGFLPPQSSDDAKRELSALVARLSQEPEWPLEEPAQIEFWGLETPPVLGDPHNPIVQLLVSTVSRVRGNKVIESVITGHSDLRHYLRNPWRSPIPACLYGPGAGRNAHAGNEHFILEHLTTVSQNLASVVMQWCGSSNGLGTGRPRRSAPAPGGLLRDDPAGDAEIGGPYSP